MSQTAAPAKPATGIKQTIQARHGVATYVPQGYTIKIINTYGKQVVDTWAFALHAPPEDSDIDKGEKENNDASKERQTDEPENKPEQTSGEGEEGVTAGSARTAVDDVKEVKEEPAEAIGDSAKEATEEPKETTEEAPDAPQNPGDQAAGGPATKKSRWSAYIPSLQRTKSQAKKKEKAAESADEKTAAKSWSSYLIGTGSKEGASANTNSQKKGWASYIPSGVGYSSYMPSKDALSGFASSHYRDPTKSYAEQLFDFSKTPVGAGAVSVATGSGYAGSIYAAYRAYETTAGTRAIPPMEYMSMMHTRATTLHLSPRVGDTLMSNVRAPLLTVVEDTSPGVHDTLIAACDPQRYKELGAEKWEEHGSCAENCVLALKEMNERSGLTGKRAIGSDVTVNTVPAPLNLFMNIPWTQSGEVSFEPPKTKRGDYIKLRAERDVVVVMSACPQDLLSINGPKPMVAHFVVEASSPEDMKEAKQKEEESNTILAKAQRRMSRGKVPKAAAGNEREKAVPDVKTAESSAPTPAVEPTSTPATGINPKTGKKAPRKLEKRTTSTAGSSAPAKE